MCETLCYCHSAVCIIIIMLPNQAIASTPSAPRPSGAEGRGSTAPLCLQLLRTSQACTRYSAILLEITRHLPLLPQISSSAVYRAHTHCGQAMGQAPPNTHQQAPTLMRQQQLHVCHPPTIAGRTPAPPRLPQQHRLLLPAPALTAL
jgi:hypothetical protein